MSVKVGIPRGLLYYRYFPIWQTFFQELGCEVVLSTPTTKGMVSQGASVAVSDLCLPIKAYFGHILSLRDRVDLLFVPRYVSVEEDAYMCPKFLGLPDMVASTIEPLPPLIDYFINYKGWKKMTEPRFYGKVGKLLSGDSRRVRRAYQKGLQRQGNFRCLRQKGVSFEKALELSISSFKGPGTKREVNAGQSKIGLVGRPYYLNDPFLNKGIAEKVTARGYSIVTTESLTETEVDRQVLKLPKKVYWSFGREMVGSALHFAEDPEVKGIINLASFGCGQDSFNLEIVSQHVERMGTTPLLSLVFDEHWSDGGLITRLDAFLDVIERQDKLSRREKG
jgi:predicted nucleotide-binding protein (sugar kinase/HSP70/actin superfamily)